MTEENKKEAEKKEENPKEVEAKKEEPKQEQPKEAPKEEKPETEEKEESKPEEAAEKEAPAEESKPEETEKESSEVAEPVAEAPAVSKKGMPKDLINKVLEAVTIAKSTGKVSRGVNETTKSIERGVAKLVVVAEDVEPEEVVMHLPVLCNEKKVPCAYVPSKLELGRASGIEVQTSSLAVTEEGDSKRLIADIASKLENLK